MVRQAVTLIGRDADCHLPLSDDEAAAPRQARFEERGTGVFLIPLATDPPVRHNGQPITETIRLAHNDQLHLGSTLLEFQEIIAPHDRLNPSPGLLQPTTVWLAVAILVLQAALLAFLVNWQRHVIRPETEEADVARAEELLAAREAAAPAEARPATVMTLPGTATPDAPPPAADPGAETESSPSPAILEMLDVADFAPVSAPQEPEPEPSTADPDTRAQESRRLLGQAVSAAEFADFPSAFRILNQLHQADPGYLPAHIEHARLLESRGDLEAAQRRWDEVLRRAPEGSEAHGKASEERRRLDSMRALQTRLLQAPEVPNLARLPRHIRIVSPEIKRSPPDTDVADMRILAAILELSTAERLFEDAVVQVFITFYDTAPDAAPRPTRAITTPSPVVLNAPFAQRRSLPIEATYVVPRGIRAQESGETGKAYSFDGYTIHVYSGQILQDAFGRPRRLLDLPVHFAGPE